MRSFPKAEVPSVEGDIVNEETTGEVPSPKDYVQKTDIAGEEPVSELIAKEFRQSPTRFMSFITDAGVMPSGTTSQEQLNNWSSEKEK